MATILDSFGTRGTLNTAKGEATIYRLNKLTEKGVGHVDKLFLEPPEGDRRSRRQASDRHAL
jgi:hypothetical protein